MPKGQRKAQPKEAQSYNHPASDSLLRPDVGIQPHFPKKKRKQPKAYRYDSSLSPSLEWDDNPARELSEWLLSLIEEASKLAPPHLFEQPREFKLADGSVFATVGGLQDAVQRSR